MIKDIFDDIILGLPKREQVLAKQFPFYSIIQNAYNNNKYRELPVSSIILAMFEYLTIEGSLKNRGIPYFEIQSFIKDVLEKGYNITLNEEELSEFVNYLFKRVSNDGSSFEYKYIDTTTNTSDVINIRYISSDIDRENGNGVLVYITTEGMEFLLNTKEIADEYKISVHVVLLQKMISTNNLEDVLRGIKSLNTEIKKQIHKKQELIETLQYASENKFNEYVKYKQLSIDMLREDSGKLKETKASIKKYEDDILSNIKKKELSKEREEKILSQIKKINLELDICLGNHQSLLDETVNLIRKLPEIQENRLTRIFSSNFNFEEKINTLVKNNSSDCLKHIIEPLLQPNITKTFNITKLDAMFSHKSKNRNDDIDEVRKEADLGVTITFEQQIEETMNDNYIFYMRNLLKFIKEQKQSDLKTFMEYIEFYHGTMPLNNLDFRGFIIELLKGENNCFNYNQIIQKEHKELIEKIFIEAIQDNHEIDFMDHELSIQLDWNNTIKISEYSDVTNIKFKCIET